jgi:signal peptidase II
MIVVALDQVTKALVLSSLAPGESESIFFGVELSVSRNAGIAFGALAGAGEAVIVALVGAALTVLLVFFAARAGRPLLWLPVGMVLGGAAGNLIDRARSGAVTDFIDPSFWPAFNVADMAIVLGVLGVLYLGEGGESGGASADTERGAGEPRSSVATSRANAGPARAGGEAAPWRDSN